MATTQMDKLAEELGCEFEWLPVSTSDLIHRFNRGISPFEGAPPSGQYDFAFRQRDAEAWASYYGMPYRKPTPPRSCKPEFAKACWIAREHGKFRDMVWWILSVAFVEGKVVSLDVLSELAEKVGLDGADLISRLEDPSIIAQYEAVMVRALNDQVFGVPACVVGGDIFWGNDRLPLVHHATRKLQGRSTGSTRFHCDKMHNPNPRQFANYLSDRN